MHNHTSDHRGSIRESVYFIDTQWRKQYVKREEVLISEFRFVALRYRSEVDNSQHSKALPWAHRTTILYYVTILKWSKDVCFGFWEHLFWYRLMKLTNIKSSKVLIWLLYSAMLSKAWPGRESYSSCFICNWNQKRVISLIYLIWE